MNLKTIQQPIEKELAEFELYFKKAMKSQVSLLDKITYYLVKRKGKQVRPMFVFFSAKLANEINQATYTAAALVEIIHTATLVPVSYTHLDVYKRQSIYFRYLS